MVLQVKIQMHQTSVALTNSVYPLEASAVAFLFAHQPHQGTLGMQLSSLDGFGDAAKVLVATRLEIIKILKTLVYIIAIHIIS